MGGASVMNNRKPVHVFVLIDALGWLVLEGQHFLQDLLPFRQPLRTVLGFSSGAIPTILTGLPPAQNGHWNLFYYDPQDSPFRWMKYLGFLPDRVLDHRVTRKLLKEMGRRLLGLGSQFECAVSPRLMPWFNWVEKKSIYQEGGVTGASSIFDELAQQNVAYRVYSYHHASDEQIFKMAQRDLREDAASFYFVYLSEMDRFLHDHCGDAGGKLDERLSWYASNLRQLFAAARERDPYADLTVFSDHGMTPVTSHFDLVKRVIQCGFKMPDDYLSVYDSTMARFWFFNAKARTKISGMLQSLSCGRILSDLELETLGVFFPDRRYGELVFLLHPGWLISHSDFNGKGWMPIGMHGYHPEDAHSDGIFLSDRRPPVPVHSVADVYYCMRRASEQRSDLVRP
jgi:predicted AlkP superfamily pyrophosphatase or phosphodiesterase